MPRFRLLLTSAALGFAPMAPLQAQEGVIAGHYLRLDEASLGNAQMSGSEQGLSLHTPSFDLLEGGFALGADYVYTHYDYTGLLSRDRDLHRLALPLSWTGGDTHTVRLTVTPTVATSSNVFKDLFSRADGDDIKVYGSATVERTPTEGWGWRIGAGYDDRFGDPQAYPVLAALYRRSNVAFEFGWPQSRVDWWPREAWRFGVEIAPAGRFWHVVSDERDGAEFDYVVDAWRAALTAEWTFAPRWHLAAQLGSEFDRHHDFEDDTGARIDEDAGSAAFAALLIRWGF